ncbi:MAG: undecaprenyl/decaprenyl-phosphate alpha-N-acetylglucosaminyl 1-phosphate transferase [Candidatus Schekmanbacteria bacterium]|nr:undecaprenyl/decaprenyl-phosphate alpha-N-acetylglucosaminyl 1-phosphate transferase [Candidatus Schekmanbacteria bacterium]
MTPGPDMLTASPSLMWLGAYATTFLAALLLSFVATAVARGLARTLGFLDRPGVDAERRIHTAPMPTSGGIAITLTFLIVLRFLGPRILPPSQLPDTGGFLFAVAVLTVIGLADDRLHLGAWAKLAGQIAAAVILYAHGYAIAAITNPLGGKFELGALALPATVLWVLALTNALNLIDGLDGLATGVAGITSATLLAMGVALANGGEAEWALVFLNCVLLGSCLGFFWHNRHPARIFLGDTGSLFLGFCLATVSLVSTRKSTTAIALLMPLICLGLPIADTGLAIVRRYRLGAPIFRADRLHLHHRLLRLGLSHRQVVRVFHLASIYLGLIAFAFVIIPYRYALIVLGLLGLGLLFVTRIIAFLEARLALPVVATDAEPRARNATLLRVAELVEAAAASASSPFARRPLAAAALAAAGALVFLAALSAPLELMYARSFAAGIDALSLRARPAAGDCQVVGEVPPLVVPASTLPNLIFDRHGRLRATRIHAPTLERFLAFSPVPAGLAPAGLQLRPPAQELLASAAPDAAIPLVFFSGIPLVPPPLHDFGEVETARSAGSSGLRIKRWEVQSVIGNSDGGAITPAFGNRFIRIDVETMPLNGDHATNQAIPYLTDLDLEITEHHELSYDILLPAVTWLRASVQASLVGPGGEELHTWSSLPPDTNGVAALWNEDLTGLALGRWYRRRIPLAKFAGYHLQTLFFMVNDDPDTGGDDRASFFFDTVGVSCGVELEAATTSPTPESTAGLAAGCAESASRRPATSPSPASGGRDGAGRCRVDVEQVADSGPAPPLRSAL